MFLVSATLAVAFVVGAAAFPARTRALFTFALDRVATNFGWFYVLSVAFFLGFALWVALSRYGEIRLGRDEEGPEFSTPSWFAMLFSAGMGIGIVFFAVAEPILHFEHPPVGLPRTNDAAKQAMNVTYFHWGPHAWGIYAVVGLALAYFGHRKGLPLSIRSTLYPVLGARTRGAAGHAVDTLAVLGTLFGLATSLGLGAAQVGAGLGHVFGTPEGSTTNLILIAVITLAATASLLSGLDRGMRILSEVNLGLAAILFCFVLVGGPTLYLLNSFADNLGNYLRSFVPRTFWTYPLSDGKWHRTWTLFYWGWWIAWAPFVGLFIARISRGRTIREFVLYVLLAPTMVTFAWLTVFGNSALHVELFGGGGIAQAVERDTATSIFALLEKLPLSAVTSVLAVAVVVTFFVTSSDSGSFVVDMLTSGGHPDPPRWQRVFWALAEGAIAAALLTVGGLEGLQSAVICLGLPFCCVLILICLGLSRALRGELRSPGPP